MRVNIFALNSQKFVLFMTKAYCVKCRQKREMENEKEIIIKGKGGTKRKALTGTCPVCKTKMFKFIKS